MTSGVVDLEEIVEDWAWNSYQKTMDKESKKIKHDDACLDINWDRVHFIPEKPTFTTSGAIIPISNVIFKSVFRNDSTTSQSHSLKTERQTTATCTSSLTKGYTKGFSVGLTLAAPGDVAQASVGFQKGFEIVNAKETSEHKTLTWATEGNITVEPKSSLTAELKVVEKQCSYTFKTRVAISGPITVAIKNKRENNNFVKSVMGDIKEILTSVGHVDKNTVYINMEGRCDFQYGIEQQICCYPTK